MIRKIKSVFVNWNCCWKHVQWHSWSKMCSQRGKSLWTWSKWTLELYNFSFCFLTSTKSFQLGESVTSILMTIVGDKICWWQIHCKDHQHNEVANIMIPSPTSLIGHHHKITNISLSPTSLSPLNLTNYPFQLSVHLWILN